jgi:3-hydroxybutyrate dehydrogenase
MSTPVAESEQPAGDFATTEQIGALVVFLCSDQAAHIHGACLPLGGGLAQ